ncbi:MAG: hypothetical protein IJD82_04460 [Clostridia bacterium]|nr:hypothetical protein [Clostridia bacterium]
MNEDFTINENNTAPEAPAPETQTEQTMPAPDPAPAPSGNKFSVSELVNRAKNLTKKQLIFIGCAAAVVLALIIGVAIYNSPSAVADRVLGRAVEDFVEREEIDYMLSLLTGGSVDVAYKGNVDGVKVDANAKLFLNADENEYMLQLLQLEAKAEGQKLGLTGSIYLSDDTVYVANDEILKGAYGVERGSMEEGLKNSILHPESESPYALDEKTYEALLQLCKVADSDLPEDLEKDMLKVMTRYTDKFYSWVKKYARFETSKQEIDLADGGKKVRVVYVIITPETVRSIVKELRDYIKEDSKLRDLVIEYYTELADILQYSANLGEEFDLRDAYDNMIDEVDTTLSNMIDGLEDEDEESFIALCMATPKSSSKLLKMWFISGDDVDDIEDEDEISEGISIDFGSKGIKKTKQITIKQAYGYKIKYTVNDEERGITEYKLSAGNTVYALRLDTKEDTFKLRKSVSYYDDTTSTPSIEGNYTTKSDKATFEFKKVKVDGEVVENADFDLTVTFEEKDRIPSPEKDVTSVFEIDDEKIEEIMKKARELMSPEE